MEENNHCECGSHLGKTVGEVGVGSLEKALDYIDNGSIGPAPKHTPEESEAVVLLFKALKHAMDMQKINKLSKEGKLFK